MRPHDVRHRMPQTRWSNAARSDFIGVVGCRFRGLAPLAPTTMLLASVAGCSLFADLGGLSKDEVVVYADAGPEQAADGATLASADASTPPADGGTSVAPDGSPAAKSGCAALGATFCVDFEGPGSLGTPVWTASDVAKANGSMKLTTDQAVSAPNAALLSTPTPPDKCGFYTLQRAFSGTFKHARAQLWVRSDVDAAPFAFIATSAVATRTYQIVIGVGGHLWGDAQKEENNAFTEIDYQSTDGIAPTNTWVKVTMDWDDATKKVTVAADANTPLVFTFPPDSALRDPWASFGAWCVPKATTMYLDDLAIWLE